MILIKEIAFKDPSMSDYVRRHRFNAHYAAELHSKNIESFHIVKDSEGRVRVFEVLTGDIEYAGSQMLTETEIKLFTTDISSWQIINTEQYRLLVEGYNKSKMPHGSYSIVFGEFASGQIGTLDYSKYIKECSITGAPTRPERITQGIVVKRNPEVTINTTIKYKAQAEHIIKLLKKEFGI